MLIEMCRRMCPGLPTDLISSELTDNMYLSCDITLYVNVWQRLNYLMLKCEFGQTRHRGALLPLDVLGSCK